MSDFVQILGIQFFDGSPAEAINHMAQNGGVLIAPSGTCFDRLTHDAEYRSAASRADLALPDSGAMVLLLSILRGIKLQRISGLTYIRNLSERLAARNETNVVWVLPHERAREKTGVWLDRQNLRIDVERLYVAPIYGAPVQDPALLALLERIKPAHVVIAIGSGPQEKLGVYLRDNLAYRPAIHCIGAALGFLTGDQVAIPDWADRFYLGWLFRLFAQPGVFIPRLARAAKLPWLILRYGEQMPPLKLESRN